MLQALATGVGSASESPGSPAWLALGHECTAEPAVLFLPGAGPVAALPLAYHCCKLPPVWQEVRQFLGPSVHGQKF